LFAFGVFELSLPPREFFDDNMVGLDGDDSAGGFSWPLDIARKDDVYTPLYCGDLRLGAAIAFWLL